MPEPEWLALQEAGGHHVNGTNGHVPEPEPDQASGPLNLPDWFWETRPVLTHIRTAAWARMISPDAVLGVVLARVAAGWPPAFQLPGTVGAESSLACYTALVGGPETGKSTAVGCASKLVALSGPVVDGVTLGSGQGLIELYMELVSVPTEDGGTRMVKQQTKSGAFVTLDEGQALAEMARQKGAIHLPVIRSMWTGGPVGQANASVETARQLADGTYSLGFVVGLQPTKAAALLGDDAAGTPQRFLWMRTTDPTIPADPPPWPGGIEWRPPTLKPHTPTGITLDPVITTEIRTARLAIVRGEVEVESLNAHRTLLRLKVAGLLAGLEERLDITTDDWDLAATVVDTSVAVRTMVVDAIAWEAADLERQHTQRIVSRDRAVEDSREGRAAAKLDQLLERLGRLVWSWVADAGAEGLTIGDIWRKIAHRDAVVLKEAGGGLIGGRELLVNFTLRRAWLEPIGDRYVTGPSAPVD